MNRVGLLWAACAPGGDPAVAALPPAARALHGSTHSQDEPHHLRPRRLLLSGQPSLLLLGLILSGQSSRPTSFSHTAWSVMRNFQKRHFQSSFLTGCKLRQR